MNNRIAESELILNPDGSVYHLNLLPHDIADTIITVGDPHRVKSISQHFDEIEVVKEKREFVTHTGRIGNKRLTVISTGIGAGNIDIVLNELDALVNIDLRTRMIKNEHTQLDIIRIGTSGSLHPDLNCDSVLISQYAIGLDYAISVYGKTFGEEAKDLQRQVNNELRGFDSSYFTQCDSFLSQKLFPDKQRGITVSCPGFYGAQNRHLRLSTNSVIDYDQLHQFTFDQCAITNLEMETSCIYAMAQALGHHALSINCILANRHHGTFSKKPKKLVNETIEMLVAQLVGG